MLSTQANVKIHALFSALVNHAVKKMHPPVWLYEPWDLPLTRMHVQWCMAPSVSLTVCFTLRFTDLSLWTYECTELRCLSCLESPHSLSFTGVLAYFLIRHVSIVLDLIFTDIQTPEVVASGLHVLSTDASHNSTYAKQSDQPWV